MAATLPLALSMAAPLHAAPPLGEVNHAISCDHHPHVNASLQVCAMERAGIAQYQIDTVDGTHAELILSGDSVELRQFGPDSVLVQLGAPVDHSAVPSGIARQVYRDTTLSIEEVQDGWRPPTWRILSGDVPYRATRTEDMRPRKLQRWYSTVFEHVPGHAANEEDVHEGRLQRWYSTVPGYAANAEDMQPRKLQRPYSTNSLRPSAQQSSAGHDHV
jgi:hypothetical protein